MKIFSGSFSTALRRQAEQRLQHVVGSFQAPAARVSLASYLPCGWFANRFFQTSRLPGTCGRPFGLDPQTRGQQHHVRIGAEHRPRRTGTGHLAADRQVEALHARGLGQIIVHRTVDARQRIEVAGQPAIVLGDQLLEERGALVRRRAQPDPPRPPRSAAPPGTTALPSRISNMPPKKSSTCA